MASSRTNPLTAPTTGSPQTSQTPPVRAKANACPNGDGGGGNQWVEAGRGLGKQSQPVNKRVRHWDVPTEHRPTIPACHNASTATLAGCIANFTEKIPGDDSVWMMDRFEEFLRRKTSTEKVFRPLSMPWELLHGHRCWTSGPLSGGALAPLQPHPAHRLAAILLRLQRFPWEPSR